MVKTWVLLVIGYAWLRFMGILATVDVLVPCTRICKILAIPSEGAWRHRREVMHVILRVLLARTPSAPFSTFWLGHLCGWLRGVYGTYALGSILAGLVSAFPLPGRNSRAMPRMTHHFEVLNVEWPRVLPKPAW